MSRERRRKESLPESLRRIFRRRGRLMSARTHGHCPTCKHYGSDCKCHEAKHTPGPWAIGSTDFGQGISMMIEPGICVVLGHGQTPDANARLIAAAPDLLAALAPFIEIWDRG